MPATSIGHTLPTQGSRPDQTLQRYPPVHTTRLPTVVPARVDLAPQPQVRYTCFERVYIGGNRATLTATTISVGITAAIARKTAGTGDSSRSGDSAAEVSTSDG